MDVSEISAQFKEMMTEGRFVMKDPWGNDTDLVLVIAGPYSHAMRAGRHKHQDKIVERTMRGAVTLTAKERENLEDEFLAEMIQGWSGLTENGREVIRTDVEAIKLLRVAPWVREQVEAIVTDRMEFNARLETGARA